MKHRVLVLALALVLLAPLTAFATGHGHAVVVRPYVGVWGWYHPWGGPYWGSYWGPYWDPFWSPYMAPVPRTGEVKLDTKVKDAQVFVNGGYVGTTKESGTLRLAPGNYTIEVREAGQPEFSQRVYVQAGKTMHLHPELKPTPKASSGN